MLTRNFCWRHRRSERRAKPDDVDIISAVRTKLVQQNLPSPAAHSARDLAPAPANRLASACAM